MTSIDVNGVALGIESFGADDAPLVLLATPAAALTGLALLALRHGPLMGLLLVVHLGFVLALFLTLPYGKFVHGFYRTLALVKSVSVVGPVLVLREPRVSAVTDSVAPEIGVTVNSKYVEVAVESAPGTQLRAALFPALAPL